MERKTTEMIKYVVHIDGAEERLRALCEASIKDKFQADESMVERVKNRLDKEMESVAQNGFATIYLHHYDLIHDNQLRPSQYFVYGTAASSVICFLLGITKENPLDLQLPLYDEFFSGVEGTREPEIGLEVDIRVYDKIIQLINGLPGVQKGVPSYGRILIIPKRNSEFEPCDIEEDLFYQYAISVNSECTFLAQLEEKTGVYLADADISETLRRVTLSRYCREDLFEKLMEYGVERKQALLVAEAVSKGFGKDRVRFSKYEEIMRNYDIPEKMIEECRKTKFLLSRACVAEEEQIQVRLRYYKTNYPREYEELLASFTKM